MESKYRIRTKDFDVSNFVHITNDCTIPIVAPWSSRLLLMEIFIYNVRPQSSVLQWRIDVIYTPFLLRRSKRSSEEISPESLSTVPQVLQAWSEFKAKVLIVSRYVVTTHCGDTFLLRRVLAFRITSHCFRRAAWRRCCVAW